jgi:hypothetical protein
MSKTNRNETAALPREPQGPSRPRELSPGEMQTLRGGDFVFAPLRRHGNGESRPHQAKDRRVPLNLPTASPILLKVASRSGPHALPARQETETNCSEEQCFLRKNYSALRVSSSSVVSPQALGLLLPR